MAGPRPVADLESAGFWSGLWEHRLELERCTSCGRHRFPPMPACPWCASTGVDAVASAGRGSVYSWVTVHRAFGEAWRDEVPYAVLTVDLDEGCRILARFDGASESLDAGLPVQATFVDHDDWTELRFVALEEDR